MFDEFVKTAAKAVACEQSFLLTFISLVPFCFAKNFSS